MKKKFYLFITLFWLVTGLLSAQMLSPTYTLPPTTSVRTMAEWEEIEALVVTWTGTATGFPNILTQIIKHAKTECKVIVICNNATAVVNYLNAFGVDTVNVQLIEDFYNSVWMRDYGAPSIYSNDVDSLYLIDWLYNRPRPLDDRIPRVLSEFTNLPLYATTSQPYDLVNTGGNFMTDGQGTAFASKLILAENGANGVFNTSIKSESDIDAIMENFMGIDHFVKTDMLPFNSINHIDMYMKLLNEETLLVGKYPAGVADGPQIEANLQYIQQNMTSVFGSPYHIIRVPMPPDTCGNYPDYQGVSCLTNDIYQGHYRTFTNLVFVNKTVLVPTYTWQYDTTALRILKNALPGYKIVGINCNEMIKYGGALHCITHSVGVKSPLLIVHQPFTDTSITAQGLSVVAKIQHQSGVASAIVHYRTKPNTSFSAVSMSSMNNTNGQYWSGVIPEQNAGSRVEYYISAASYSGKTQNRPITAPNGFWTFEVETNTAVQNNALPTLALQNIYPNPTGDRLFFPIQCKTAVNADISIFDVKGQHIKTVHKGNLTSGNSTLETSIRDLPNGSYYVVLRAAEAVITQPLIVEK